MQHQAEKRATEHRVRKKAKKFHKKTYYKKIIDKLKEKKNLKYPFRRNKCFIHE